MLPDAPGCLSSSVTLSIDSSSGMPFTLPPSLYPTSPMCHHLSGEHLLSFKYSLQPHLLLLKAPPPTLCSPHTPLRRKGVSITKSGNLCLWFLSFPSLIQLGVSSFNQILTLHSCLRSHFSHHLRKFDTSVISLLNYSHQHMKCYLPKKWN